ncbi:MAG: M23 family metallopeptidase [Desertimonas sp.]
MNRVLIVVAAAGVAVLLIPILLVTAIMGGFDDSDSLCGPSLPGGNALGVQHAVDPDTQAAILATIRHRESGGDYTAINRGDGQGGMASGAYQFMTGTWNNFAGYRDAYLAPPEVQDERAVLLMNDALNAAGGDWTMIPVVWYVGHIPADLDYVPAPGEGNRLTVAEYRDGWLRDFERIANGELPDVAAGSCAGIGGGAMVAGDPIPAVGGLAPPLGMGVGRDIYNSGHGGYAASDLILATGAPIYVMRGGTVRSLPTYGANCQQQGLSRDACKARRVTCGIGVTIQDAEFPDVRWTYCHMSARTDLAVGQHISAGEMLGLVGNSGWSGTPHLHLEVRIGPSANRDQRCPQPLMLQAYDDPSMMIDPRSLPRTGCF